MDARTVVDPTLQRYADLDQRLLAAVRPIRILPTVAWPASLEGRMIEAYAAGRLSLPEVSYLPPDLSAARAELAAIEREAGHDDPLGEYLCRTADETVVPDVVPKPKLTAAELGKKVFEEHFGAKARDEIAALAELPADKQWLELGKVLSDAKGCINCHTTNGR